ncbi:polyketide synthase [Moniliophthora roreri]|nr:polyketide synthase [Moniliophthora roreri]
MDIFHGWMLASSFHVPSCHVVLYDVSAASVNLNSLRAVQFSESPKHIFQPTRGAPEAPSLTFLPSHRRRVVSTITWADSEEVTMLIGSLVSQRRSISVACAYLISVVKFGNINCLFWLALTRYGKNAWGDWL